jgi:lipopolysaccharide/colanic/teichoic acid biosynthesis glycosyltransferase
MKRLFDIIICFTVLPFILPLMAAAAAAVIIDSGFPAIFLQDRVGRNDRVFRIYKFRTMIPDAERKGPLLAERGDPRVTRVGRFLRRWSLDELPQIFNVLRGDMSLVGPRPELPQLVASYNHWQRQVLQGLPGVTGFSQIHGRDDLSMDTKLRLDIYYLRHRSLGLDIWIIWRTAFELVSGRGAF